MADGKTSRLYKTLVYDKQVASDVSAFNYALESSGGFIIIATARPGHTNAELKELIDAEVKKLAADGPTADEVESAKAKRELNFINGLQRIGGFGGKADIINKYNTYLGSPDYLSQDIQRYRKITAADVRDVVARYVNTTHRLVVNYDPESSGRADAAEFDRKAPSFGPRAPFTPPAIETKTLANGLGHCRCRRAPRNSRAFRSRSSRRQEPRRIPPVKRHWMDDRRDARRGRRYSVLAANFERSRQVQGIESLHERRHRELDRWGELAGSESRSRRSTSWRMSH